MNDADAIKWLMDQAMKEMVDTSDYLPTGYVKPAKIPKTVSPMLSVPEITVDPNGPNKTKWVKMGNKAKRPNQNLYRISMDVTNETVEMYPDEATWKDAIKIRMAEQLARNIVGKMHFTQIGNAVDGTTTIFGRVFVTPVDEMDEVYESTTMLEP